MDNPSLILQTRDRHLDHSLSLVIYGRAALWLGFESSPPEAAQTQDVDAIISVIQEKEPSADGQFWDAIEATDAELAARELYLTHLFSEREIFLRREWVRNVVPISRLFLTHVKLSRPATIDLVLSKMMRGRDPQDMTDAEFMIRHDRISQAQLLEAFGLMKSIESVELRVAFTKAKPAVLEFAESFS